MENRMPLASAGGKVNIALCRLTKGNASMITVLAAVALGGICILGLNLKTDLTKVLVILLPFGVNALYTCLRYFGTISFSGDGYEIKTVLKTFRASFSDPVKIERIDHIALGANPSYHEIRISSVILGKKEKIVLFTDKLERFGEFLERANIQEQS